MRQSIWTTIELPKGGSPGVIAEGSFEVIDDVVRVFGAKGDFISKARLMPGEDAAAAARRLLRKGRASGFYGPIAYRPRSIV